MSDLKLHPHHRPLRVEEKLHGKQIVTKEHWTSSWSEHTSDVAVAYCTYFKTTFLKRERKKKNFSRAGRRRFCHFSLCACERRSVWRQARSGGGNPPRAFHRSRRRNPAINRLWCYWRISSRVTAFLICFTFNVQDWKKCLKRESEVRCTYSFFFFHYLLFSCLDLCKYSDDFLSFFFLTSIYNSKLHSSCLGSHNLSSTCSIISSGVSRTGKAVSFKKNKQKKNSI